MILEAPLCKPQSVFRRSHPHGLCTSPSRLPYSRLNMVPVVVPRTYTDFPHAFVEYAPLLHSKPLFLGDAGELAGLDGPEHVGLCWSFPYLDPAQLGPRTPVRVIYAFAVDALYTYAGAIENAIRYRMNPFSPGVLSGLAAQTVLPTGLTGYTQFTQQFERVGTYSLINLVAPGVKRVVVNDTLPAPPEPPPGASSWTRESSSEMAGEGTCDSRCADRADAKAAPLGGPNPRAGGGAPSGLRAKREGPPTRATHGPSRRTLEQQADIVYAGNQTTFDNRFGMG